MNGSIFDPITGWPPSGVGPNSAVRKSMETGAMTANKTMTMLAGLVIAGLFSGAAAAPAEAQCYTTRYYVGPPVEVTPMPGDVASAPGVVSTPVVYRPPVRYVTTYVGYSGGYPRRYYYPHVYRHGHRRHHGHYGKSWGFGFTFGRR